MFCFVFCFASVVLTRAIKAEPENERNIFFHFFTKCRKKTAENELTFALGFISASNRKADARPYFTDVTQLFKHAAAFATSHHVSVALHGLNVFVFIRR